MRHAARRDANESAIRSTLTEAGIPYRVISCPALGDLEVVLDGTPWLIEVKDGLAPYTKAQVQRREWLEANGVDLRRYAPTWRDTTDVAKWILMMRKS